MALVLNQGTILSIGTGSHYGGRFDASPNNPDTYRADGARWANMSTSSGQERVKGWGECTSWTLYELACRSAAVGQCVEFIGDAVGMLRSVGGTRDENDCFTALAADDELQQILAEPAPGMTQQMWKQALRWDYDVFGNCYAWKVRFDDGENRLWLLPLPGELVTVAAGAGTFGPREYILGTGDTAIRIPAGDIIHWARTPVRNGRGKSPLVALADVLSEEHASTQHRKAIYQTGVAPAGFIEVTEHYDGTSEKLERLARQIQNRNGGAKRAGTVVPLERGMKWVESNIDPRSLEYLSVRQLTKAEVADRYKLPRSTVGDGSGGNAYAAKRADREHLYSDVLAPSVLQFDQMLTMCLRHELQRPDIEIITSWKEKLRPDPEAHARALTALAGGPIVSVNEARGELELKPVDGGEDIRDPLNMGDLNDPNPTAATPNSRSAARPAPAAPPEPVDPASKNDDPTPPQRRTWRMKALDRGDEADNHAELLRRTFERQRRAVQKAVNNETTPVFDRERWDRELADDLEKLTAETMATFWARWADELDLEDPPDPDWAEAARIEANDAAERINTQTEERLGEALAADPDDITDDIDKVFNDERRSEAAAERAVTWVAGFTGVAAARSGGFTHKRWVPTRASDRHPPEPSRIPLGDRFSNGGRHPGEGADTYGCQCILEFD